MGFFENRRRCKAFLAQRVAQLEAMSTEDLLREFGGDGGVHEEYPADAPLGDPQTLHVRVEAIPESEPGDEKTIGIHVICYTMDFNFTFPVGCYFPRKI